MTVAVCLKCGEFKHGAWTPCRACGYTPDDDESYTKHLLVTDHYLSREQLDDVSKKVKRGEAIDFPADLLKQAWVKKADVDRSNRSCTVGCVILLLAIIVLAGLALWWRVR